METEYKIVKTGLNEYDVRENGITIYECPSKRSAQKHIDALKAGIISSVDVDVTRDDS